MNSHGVRNILWMNVVYHDITVDNYNRDIDLKIRQKINERSKT